MKSFLKYSTFAIGTFVVASAFVACNDDDDEAVYATKYTPNTVNLKKAGNAVDLGLSVLWADMNVGAASESDNGLLFSWGDITGTKIEENPYSVLLSPTEVSALYESYKGEEKTALDFDTVKIDYAINSASLNASLLDIKTIVGDTLGQDSITRASRDRAKMEAINDLLASKVNYVKDNYKYEGLLEARLIAGEFDLTANHDGSKLTYRMKLEGAEERDSHNFYQTFSDEEVLTIDFYAITSSEVKFFESNNDPKYDAVKDQYEVEAYKVYVGNDYSNIPVYSLKGNAECDAATANWGSQWRIPTNEEIKELLEKCEWEFEGNGYKVTGPSGNSIFLPAAGYRYDNNVVGAGIAGYYASLGNAWGTYHYPSTKEQVAGSKGYVNAENTKNYLIFQNGQFNVSKNLYNNITTNYAASIRPVKAK